MPFYDPKFNQNARKVLAYNLLIENSFKAGRIGETAFAGRKRRLYEKLSLLRKQNLDIIQRETDDLNRQKDGLKQQQEKGLVNGEQYESLLSELEQRQMDLAAEKNLIDLCDDEGYVKYLNDHLAFLDSRAAIGLNPVSSQSPRPGYGRTPDYGAPSLRVETSDDVPWWASVTVVVMLVLALSAGVLFKSVIVAVIALGAVVAGLALGIIILHASVYVAGVENATIGKAFACVMANILINTAAGIAVILILIVVAIIEGHRGIAGLTPGINILGGVVSLLILLTVVKHFYDTTWGKAAIALSFEAVISIAIAALLSAVMGFSVFSLLLRH